MKRKGVTAIRRRAFIDATVPTGGDGIYKPSDCRPNSKIEPMSKRSTTDSLDDIFNGMGSFIQV